MKKKFWQYTIIGIILLIALLFGAGLGALLWIIEDTPDISNYGEWKPSEGATIYSADGQIIDRLYTENRIYVPLSKIPDYLEEAVVAIEDERFYQHHGIDFWGIIRAIIVDIKHMAKVQGASTITQQLARHALLHHKKTFYRKIQEAVLATQFERYYTKDEILEFYLNEIYLGHRAYGVQAAAKQYFGKDVEDLTLAECALIAALPQSPNNISPYNNMERARERRNIILSRMAELNYITERQAEEAKKEPIRLVGLKPPAENELAPHFVDYVREKLISMFGWEEVYQGGLKVYTSLDLDIQKKAMAEVKKAFDSKNGYLPAFEKMVLERENSEKVFKLQPQIAVVTLDPVTGEIKAMVGGRPDKARINKTGKDSFEKEPDKFNRAVNAVRQPGSAFKPFVYVTGLKQGLSPGTVIDDTRMVWENPEGDPYIPKNWDDKYLGPITLRRALAKSVNVAAVKLLDQVGIGNVINTAKELGITTLVQDDHNLAIALGGLTRGVTPLNMAQAYATFANGGIRVEPVAILKVEDTFGNVIYEHEPERKIVLSEEVAYLMTDMLRSVVIGGRDWQGRPWSNTGWRVNIPGHYIAGKTGTTQNSTDAWFVGFTLDYVTSVWIGEDNSRPMKYLPKKDEEGNPVLDENGEQVYGIEIGSWAAAKFFRDYMGDVLEGKPKKVPSRPAKIVEVDIDTTTGLLPGPYTPEKLVRTELFIEGTEPKEVENLHQPEYLVAKIDTSTGYLARPNYCPKEVVEEQLFQHDTLIRVDKRGVPVKKVDPETQIPLTDENGNYIYETMPKEYCPVHIPDYLKHNEEGGLIDQLWNFFRNIKEKNNTQE